MNTVEARDLTKVFRAPGKGQQIMALDHFSLSVRTGEIFGLLGPNGAGKTTFIKVLLSIVFPTGGDATLFGVPLNDSAVKSRIGYLPENHKYPPYLSGEQVLDYFGKLSGMEETKRRAMIDDLLRRLGMEKWRNLKIKKYSKGMMQRIGLAQALINNPDLIILDEPTDGVDPIARKEIRDLLVERKKAGKTIFVNSHLLSEVEMISDRVAIMNKGKLVTLGTVKELTETPQEYVVALAAPLPGPLAIEWQAKQVRFTAEDSTLRIRVASIPELNAMIDALRGRSCDIVSIMPKKNSLEDLFIDIIKKENG